MVLSLVACNPQYRTSDEQHFFMTSEFCMILYDILKLFYDYKIFFYNANVLDNRRRANTNHPCDIVAPSLYVGGYGPSALGPKWPGAQVIPN